MSAAALLTACDYAIVGGGSVQAFGLRGRYWWARPGRPAIFSDEVVFTHTESGCRIGQTTAHPSLWCAILSALDAVELPRGAWGQLIYQHAPLAVLQAVLDNGGHFLIDGKWCSRVEDLPKRFRP